MLVSVCPMHGEVFRSCQEQRDHEAEFHGGALITTLFREEDDDA